MGKDETIQEIIEGLSRLHRPVKKLWRANGLSHAQISMLYTIYCHDNSSFKEVALHMGVSQSAVTQLLEPLIQKNLVVRRPNPKDKRQARLELTTKGVHLIKKIKKLKVEKMRSALSSLSKNELDEMVRLLGKMGEN